MHVCSVNLYLFVEGQCAGCPWTESYVLFVDEECAV